MDPFEIAQGIVRWMGLDNKSAIGTTLLAGICMIIAGGVFYLLGVFIISTVSGSIPLITTGALNTSQSLGNMNIANAFNIVGIGLIIGGIITILYEILPLTTMFMTGRRE